jgi:hypothetical protein
MFGLSDRDCSTPSIGDVSKSKMAIAIRTIDPPNYRLAAHSPNHQPHAVEAVEFSIHPKVSASHAASTVARVLELH